MFVSRREKKMYQLDPNKQKIVTENDLDNHLQKELHEVVTSQFCPIRPACLTNH